jgi:signal transduction histidine kinase
MHMDGRACVLIVDDEEHNRALLRAMLAAQYRLLEAGSGAEALRVLDAERADLVLLDVMMPKMSGYEVCKKIKQRSSDPFLPVLLVTALSAQDERNLGLEAGADDFLAKPVDRRELLLRVGAFLRLRAQDALIRVQLRQLAELQNTKDEMVSLMVHDLRSPLSGVIAHLDLALEDAPEGRLQQDLHAALRGANAIRDSLEDALQIRLLEAGHLPIVRSPVNLETLVASAAHTFEPVGRRKRIAVAAAVEGPPTASVDGKLLRRAVENLLANALKYTPAGGDVFIAARHRDGAVEIEVGDRGPGIPADLKPAMFEKYGSIEAKKGGPRKGFGLGLYMVKLVADGHGGTAEVVDREGGGAVFRLRVRATA